MTANFIQIGYLRRNWSQSKIFRRLLIGAAIYLLFRLALQGVVLAQVLSAGPIASETTLISNDLQIYMTAALRLVNHQELYLQEALDRVAVYQYAPSFALALTPFLRMPFGILALLHTLLNLSSYLLLYLGWGRIFHRLGLHQANDWLAWTLPVWVVFAGFWGDLSYLNIYIITALICTWLIEAVLTERLGWSLVWVSILLQTKPYLAFPLMVPLILGRPRFFIKLIALALVGYVTIVGTTILLMGPAYGWEQYEAYLRFLANMTADFPWRGPESGFLGYNHSILQIVYYWFGIIPNVLRLAIIIKICLLLPLAGVSLRHWLRPAGCAGCEAPQLSLCLMFAWYTGAMIWLDIVWEMTLGIAALAYLLATLEQRRSKIWVLAIFLAYALLDFWQVASFIALGPDIIASDLYIWTDPSIYIPMVMGVIMVFYGLLLNQLWHWPVPSANQAEMKTAELVKPIAYHPD
ncbi:MAG: glycosyltransferase 87 family protein [Anaerolineae bacterium]